MASTSRRSPDKPLRFRNREPRFNAWVNGSCRICRACYGCARHRGCIRFPDCVCGLESLSEWHEMYRQESGSNKLAESPEIHVSSCPPPLR